LKKCEVFACPNLSVQIYQVAAGTLVWLCDECVKEMEIEVAKESGKEMVHVDVGNPTSAGSLAVVNNL